LMIWPTCITGPIPIIITWPLCTLGAIIYTLIHYRTWRKIIPLAIILPLLASMSYQYVKSVTFPETLTKSQCAKLDEERQHIKDYFEERVEPDRSMDKMFKKIMSGENPNTPIFATDILPKIDTVPLDIFIRALRYEKIAHAVGACGSDFPGFFEQVDDMCRADNPAEFEKDILPLCEKALFHKDNEKADRILNTIIRFYTKEGSTYRNHKKAVNYIDKFLEIHPNKTPLWWLWAKAEILRHGGYGIEKDEETSFRIIKDIEATQKIKGQIKCELSLYHRHGTGTPVNEKKADKWLKAYKKEKPKGKCVHEKLYVFDK